MIELKGITKRYLFKPAINNVDLTIKPGEILGYLGPNGAGKTTTVKILATLIEPSEGEISFYGRNIKNILYDYKKSLGYVPENPDIYTYLSAYEYLLLVGRLRRISENILKEKITCFLELFKLSEYMYSSMSTYSKGMIQKVLISAALLHNPDVILLDEPFSGLDVTSILVMRELLKKLSKEGKIILYSTHILETVEKICTRVIIIHKGLIVANDSVKNLKKLKKIQSLEEIFKQATEQENIKKIVNRILEIIKL